MLKTTYNYENLVDIIETDIPWIKIRSGGDDGHPCLSYELLVFNPYCRSFEIRRDYEKMTELLKNKYYRTPSNEDIDISKHYKFLQRFNIEINSENIENQFYEEYDMLSEKIIDEETYKTIGDLMSEYWLRKINKKISKIVYSYVNIPKLSETHIIKYDKTITKNQNGLLYSYWVPKNKTIDFINKPWYGKYVNTQIMIEDINAFLDNIPDDCEEIFIPINSNMCYRFSC